MAGWRRGVHFEKSGQWGLLKQPRTFSREVACTQRGGLGSVTQIVRTAGALVITVLSAVERSHVQLRHGSASA